MLAKSSTSNFLVYEKRDVLKTEAARDKNLNFTEGNCCD